MKKLLLANGILASISMFFWILMLIGFILIVSSNTETHYDSYYHSSYSTDGPNYHSGASLVIAACVFLSGLWIAMLVISIIILCKPKPAAVGLTIASGVLGIMTNILVPPLATLIVSFIAFRKY